MKTTFPVHRTAALPRLITLAQVSIAFLALTLFSTTASAEHSVYVVTVTAIGPQFGAVNLENGEFTPIGQPSPAPLANLVWSKGSLISLATSDPYPGYLVKIDPETGALTVVGPTGLGYNAFDVAEVRGKLYVTDFQNNIYSVDQETGRATMITATGIPPDPNIPFTTNGDGTFNLCDESLYGVKGSLYATFDSFNMDPTTLVINKNPTDSTVSPALYRIDPSTGTATLVGPTDLGLGSTVAVDGKFYAFRLSMTGFVGGFPQAFSELVSLDLTTGKTTFLRIVDPAAGMIFGAAPRADFR